MRRKNKLSLPNDAVKGLCVTVGLNALHLRFCCVNWVKVCVVFKCAVDHLPCHHRIVREGLYQQSTTTMSQHTCKYFSGLQRSSSWTPTLSDVRGDTSGVDVKMWKPLLLPPESLWQNSFHWSPGRSSLGRSLPLWLARPCGWSPWTLDLPGTRSCDAPETRVLDPCPRAAVSPGSLRDSRAGCAPRSPVCSRRRLGGCWAPCSWNPQSRGAERQADLSRPWFEGTWGVILSSVQRRQNGERVWKGRKEKAGQLFCWLALTLANKIRWLSSSGKRRDLLSVLICNQSALKSFCQ